MRREWDDAAEVIKGVHTSFEWPVHMGEALVCGWGDAGAHATYLG